MALIISAIINTFLKTPFGLVITVVIHFTYLSRTLTRARKLLWQHQCLTKCVGVGMSATTNIFESAARYQIYEVFLEKVDNFLAVLLKWFRPTFMKLQTDNDLTPGVFPDFAH